MGTIIRDPRVRQTLNQISDNIESVADTAKFGCFNFTKSYLEPCINSIATVCPSTETACPCFYHDGLTSRRRRRGQPEFAFEFYNSDYDDEYAPGDPLRWGNDELDRLLAGSGVAGRRRKAGARNDGMYYTRSGQRRVMPEGRRKSALPRDSEPDPTIIPNTAALGFLGYFPWIRKRQALRYKPSAADLQDHPGGYGGVGGEFREEEVEEEEIEGLLGIGRRDNANNTNSGRRDRRGRGRSGTTSSGDTTDTFRSRADLFPSEDEADAIALDDEFEINLDPETGSTGKKSKKGPRRQRTIDTSSTGLSGNGSIGSPARGRRTSISDEFRIEDDVDIDFEDAREIDIMSPIRTKSDEELRREEEEIRLSSEGPSSPLLDTADRAVPMFDAISPVLIPDSDVEDTPPPLTLTSKESEYPSDSAVDISENLESGDKTKSVAVENDNVDKKNSLEQFNTNGSPGVTH
ncbi:hypothetical protein ABW20_dc0102603 [Dactylellina cionopaga]|nr:hypothetical protein ABW20_dc0102603 [Dactylellina cionopaga]